MSLFGFYSFIRHDGEGSPAVPAEPNLIPMQRVMQNNKIIVELLSLGVVSCAVINNQSNHISTFEGRLHMYLLVREYA